MKDQLRSGKNANEQLGKHRVNGLPDQLLCHLVSPWLNLNDFIQLDNASSHALHEELMGFVRSSKFRELFGDEFKANNSLSPLEWARKVEVNADVILELSSLDIWSELADNTEWVVRPYNCVKAISIEDAVSGDWDLDFLHKFAYLGPLYFPCVKSLLLFVILENVVNDHLLDTLNMLARSWDIQELVISDSDPDFCYDVDSITVTGICRLLVSLGDKLETLSLQGFCEVPGAVLDAIVQHCPNITNLLPDSMFAEEVDMDRYLKACVRCKHLEVLDIGKNYGLVPDDSLVASAMQQLGSLKAFLCDDAHLQTFQAAAACLTHCPLIEIINLKGMLHCTIDRSAAGGARSSLKLRCKGAQVDSEAFEMCLAQIPGLSELALVSFSASEMDLLASLLVRTRRSEQLVHVTLELIDFADISPIFRALPNLATLSLKARDAYESSCFGTAFDHCVGQIALHCTQLRSLTLLMPKMADVDFLTLTLKLPSLTTLKLSPDDARMLTDWVWGYLAAAHKLWKCVELPEDLKTHAAGLVTAIREDGLRVKELRLGNDAFRFGPITAEDVGRKLL
eukprot:gene33969-41107_t